MKFVVRNHRDRKKLTLSAAHSDTIEASITLTLTGKRMIELSDRLCEKYAESIEQYVSDGALIPLLSE